MGVSIDDHALGQPSKYKRHSACLPGLIQSSHTPRDISELFEGHAERWADCSVPVELTA
jgi:hypothetical protein